MLTVASNHYDYNCVDILLKNGANFKRIDLFGNSILHLAALGGNM